MIYERRSEHIDSMEEISMIETLSAESRFQIGFAIISLYGKAICQSLQGYFEFSPGCPANGSESQLSCASACLAFAKRSE
jgi:hypothetical protein